MKTIKLFSILAWMLLAPFTAANAQNSLVGDVNKDGRVDVSDAVMVVDIILHGQKDLSLSVNEISLSKGNNVTIVITSGYGSYTVTSTDTNIADATLSGSTVIITGKNGGTTVVKVIDTISGDMQEVNVQVLTPLSFSANSAELIIGETTTIDITSGNGNYEVTSSNVNVVEASLSGTTIVLTGKAKGIATVTVKDVVTGSTEDISVTVKDAPISYSKCPDGNHPHMIDLGLPSGTKWACCNEGASTPEDYGGYYTFGQVSSAPTVDQIKELLDNCSYQWTTQNGVNGGRFTGPNGGSVFLPAAGYRRGEWLLFVGYRGYYWSSTPGGEYYAYGLYFDSGCAGWDTWDLSSYYDRSVRPVR